MESEASIISACIADRTAYDVVVQLESNADLSPNGVVLFKFIAEYYKRDGKCQSVDVEVLLSTIETQKPMSCEKLAKVLDNLPEPSPANLITLLTEQRLKRIAADMTAAFASGDTEKAANLADEYNDVYKLGVQSEETEDALFEVYQGTTMSELEEQKRKGGNLVLLPDILGHIVYDLAYGDHICIFGMVNRGKSTVCAQIAGDFAYNDNIVLYIGNEDPAVRMVQRFICNMAACTVEEAREDEKGTTARAMAEGYGNIIFKHLPETRMGDIRRLIERFEPDVVIVDQARNVIPDGKEKDGAAKMETIFHQLRMLYSKYGVLGVSVTQAGDKDAKGKPLDNKVKLEQNDIADSKYGVAATMDVMIGIGATKPMMDMKQLYLNVCKNKATLIHDGVICTIDSHIYQVRVD